MRKQPHSAIVALLEANRDLPLLFNKQLTKQVEQRAAYEALIDWFAEHVDIEHMFHRAFHASRSGTAWAYRVHYDNAQRYIMPWQWYLTAYLNRYCEDHHLPQGDKDDLEAQVAGVLVFLERYPLALAQLMKQALRHY